MHACLYFYLGLLLVELGCARAGIHLDGVLFYPIIMHPFI
jgi:hypothetical protein